MDAMGAMDSSTITVIHSDEAEDNWTWQDDEATAKASVDTPFNDMLDARVEPAVMLSSVNTLLETLESIVASLASLREQAEDKEDANIQATGDECKKLYEQLTELAGVVSFYVSRHEPNLSSAESDIDPGLYLWSSDCLVFLLELQAYVDRLRGPSQQDPDSEWEDAFIDHEEADEDKSLEEYQMKLVVFNSYLEDFIPILKVDLSEHQASKMHFPRAIAESSSTYLSSNRHDYGRLPHVKNPLREELYRLKDAIQDCRDRLLKLLPHFSDSTRPLVHTLRARQNMALNALTEMLTNHGSDWIEAGLSGKLTYEEFIQLPLDRIKDFRIRIQQFTKDIGFMQAMARAGNYKSSIKALEGMGLEYVDVDGGDKILRQLLIMLKLEEGDDDDDTQVVKEHPAAREAAESDPFSSGC